MSKIVKIGLKKFTKLNNKQFNVYLKVSKEKSEQKVNNKWKKSVGPEEEEEEQPAEQAGAGCVSLLV